MAEYVVVMFFLFFSPASLEARLVTTLTEITSRRPHPDTYCVLLTLAATCDGAAPKL